MEEPCSKKSKKKHSQSFDTSIKDESEILNDTMDTYEAPLKRKKSKKNKRKEDDLKISDSIDLNSESKPEDFKENNATDVPLKHKKSKKKKDKKNNDLEYTDSGASIKTEELRNGTDDIPVKEKVEQSSLKGGNDAMNSPTEDISAKRKKNKKNKSDNLHTKGETNNKDKLSNHTQLTAHTNDLNNESNFIQRPYNNNYNSKNNFYQKKEEIVSRYPDLSEDISLKNKGKHFTTSIAVPASILEETCLLQELRTYVIGQLARCACIYSVDEIIVYNDNCWRSSRNSKGSIEDYMCMMKMILEYQECPQYLRKDLFPKHNYMRKAGVLNAVNAPHHLLAHQWCPYREGVVVSKYNGKNSYVDVGLKNYVEVDRKLEAGLRVTVKFPPEAKTMKKMYGTVVSPEEPRTTGGLYWGYTVRLANSLSEVFKSDRFKGGYDLVIGTSDKGTDAQKVSFDRFSHALIVFGGVDGLEAAIQGDKSLLETDPKRLFPHYLNVCTNQSSRTIRTEEAVLITLSTISHKLCAKGNNKPR